MYELRYVILLVYAVQEDIRHKQDIIVVLGVVTNVHKLLIAIQQSFEETFETDIHIIIIVAIATATAVIICDGSGAIEILQQCRVAYNVQ
jgi:hypothetical protein